MDLPTRRKEKTGGGMRIGRDTGKREEEEETKGRTSSVPDMADTGEEEEKKIKEKK